MHPDCEDFTDVLCSSDCMFTQEGEGTVFDEVTREDWLHDQVQNHKLLNELHETLALSSLQTMREVEVVVAILVVVVKLAFA
jgi:hypothetical protein